MARPKRPPYESILVHLKRCTVNGTCLIWPGATSGRGYPVAKINGGKDYQYLHRVIYEVCVGRIPADTETEVWQVDHICPNSLCLNPDHLRCLVKEDNKYRSNLLYGPIYTYIKEVLNAQPPPF